MILPATPDDCAVLIVGAGPSGLALALTLTHHGIRCRVVDERTGPDEAPRAMVVQARTLELYRQLGFAERLIEHGVKVDVLELSEDGEAPFQVLLGDIASGTSPYPFLLCIPQRDHERLLATRLAEHGVEVEWNSELSDLYLLDDAVEATLVGPAEEQRLKVRYLCGCDGAYSRTRTLAGIDGRADDSRLFYVAEVRLADDSLGHTLRFELGQQRIDMLLPHPVAGLRQLVGTLDESSEDSPEPEALRPRLERIAGGSIERIERIDHYRTRSSIAERFSHGHLLLVGDAAHQHSPLAGQGMNTGIGDAINLGWKLAAVLEGHADESLLESYTEERRGVAKALEATSDRLFQGALDHGLKGRLLRSFLVPHLVPFLSGFPKLRRTLFQTLSQTRIEYRRSPLSAGLAGEVHGGDRLPWVSIDDSNEDNFSTLDGLRWQLHVYGTPKMSLVVAAAALGLELELFDWSDSARLAGLKRDASYLIRPDGHVALASPSQDVLALKRYVDWYGLSFG